MVVTFFMIETLRNVLKNITKRSNLWLMLWIFFMNKAGQIEKKITEKPEDMKRSCDILGIWACIKKIEIEDDRFLFEIPTFFYLVKKEIQQKTKCGKI